MRLDVPGAAIDQTQTLRFDFDGRSLAGHPGDTLASALLANDIHVVGRSPYLDRPRGILSCGAEEPNGLVELSFPGYVEPMARVTTVELCDGLAARSLAGRGRAVEPSAAPRCDKRFHHCDVLVIGGGWAGVSAAATAAADGLRVLLVEERAEIDGEATERIGEASEVVVATRTTALSLDYGGHRLLAERLLDRDGRLVGERLWHVRAERTILASGAHERPLVFAQNDLPGVMLAGAARAYATRYAVAPGNRAVVFTTNDSAYDACLDLVAGGVAVPLLVDARPEPPAAKARALRELGVEVRAGAVVAGAIGERQVCGVEVAALDRRGALGGQVDEEPCDLLAVSGGWTPALQLYTQAGGRVEWHPGLAAHLPAGIDGSIEVVGAAAGEGLPAGRALWCVPPSAGGSWDTHFVDLQRDVTVAHVRRAVDAGLRSPEHVKRYTTIGTGEDQGKTSAVNALGIIAELTGTEIDRLQAPTTRQPYIPVSFAAMAGQKRGRLLDPVRTTPIHSWHEQAGAVFEDVGQWKRARYYPLAGEDMEAAVLRECAAAREGVAVTDASTLGKIDVRGPDAAEFLDRIYTNVMSTVPVGACRYGVMCKANGMLFDDGVAMRIGADHYVLTTTTGGAASVYEWLEEWLQTEWPDLRVHLTSVTDHWSTIAVVGPDSRALMEELAPAIELGSEEFPFMAIREGTVGGIAARVCRVSFSGELAYEIHLPRRFALSTWEAVMEVGRAFGIVAYGLEALHVLRAEKGYLIIGQDSDETTTPQDAGMDWIVSKKKDFFIGRRSHRRVNIVRPDRRQLVGLLPTDPAERLPEGAQLLLPGTTRSSGYVTSSYRSAALGRTFALGLLEAGRERHRESVRVLAGGKETEAQVTDAVFVDPEGRRRDGRPA